MLLPKLDRELKNIIDWIKDHIPGGRSNPKHTTPTPVVTKPIPGSSVDPIHTRPIPVVTKPIPGGPLDPITPITTNTMLLPKLDREISDIINWIEKHV
jgi:hypothetical protein